MIVTAKVVYFSEKSSVRIGMIFHVSEIATGFMDMVFAGHTFT
jgi:hypothetical protein